MSNSKEKISAYLDDDLSVSEFEALSLSDELTDEKAFGVASRYQLMGDAMRGEVSDASMVDISAQVREALHHETLAMSKPAASQVSRKTTARVFDFNAWFTPFVKPLGGLAVAASVALVTVIAVTRVDSVSEPVAQLAEAESQKVNIPATALAAREEAKPVVATVAVSNKAGQGRAAAYLNTYLTEHAEFAAQDTMQGRMPYARAVSYESR